jgi:hypothetical protein
LNIILAEDYNYPIGSFIDKVRSRFPRTSQISVNSNNIHDIKKIAKSPPLLKEGWLILFFLRDYTPQIMKDFDIPENLNVIIVRSADALAEVSRLFTINGIVHNVVNNLNPDNKTIVSYVMRELSVSRDIAEYIAKRHNYYLPQVTESVEILRNLDDISRDSIKKYTRKSADISFNSLFDYIIGVERKSDRWGNSKSATPAKIASLLENYRYGADFIFKFIVKRFDSYLYVYDKLMEGNLSLENYLNFYEVNKSEMKNISEYLLKKIINSFSMVSYEKLWYLSNVYKRELEKGATLTGLIQLLRLSEH